MDAYLDEIHLVSVWLQHYESITPPKFYKEWQINFTRNDE